MTQSTKMKPHQQAPHVAELLQILPPEEQMALVRAALVDALVALGAEGAADLATRNRWRSCDGVAEAAAAYSVCLQVFAEISFSWNGSPHMPHLQAADELASICLQAIERGQVIERDRRHIPLLLASIVGFVPDRASNAAKKRRVARSSYLLIPIGKALKDNPDGTWKTIAASLEGDGVVTAWDDCLVQYWDEKERPATITVGAFQNLITKAGKTLRS